MSLNYAQENFKFFPYIKSFQLNDGIKKDKRLTQKQKKDKRLTAFQIKVYGYIYSWNEAGYYCKVSMEGIAEYLECSPTTVENAIPKLERLGWINIVHGQRHVKSAKNACNIYTIKRKPKATKAVKAVKVEVEPKPEPLAKSEFEIKTSKIWAIDKIMQEIGASYDERASITDKLKSLLI